MAWVRKMRVYTSRYSDRSKQRNHSGDLSKGRKIILKCTPQEKYVESTGSGLRISVSRFEHGNGKSVSIAAQELTEHLSNYSVTCGCCSTGPCSLLLHFTHLWALFPSAQGSLWLPFPVHPPTLRPSARPPVAAHRVEVYVSRTPFFGLLSFMITEPVLAATWTEAGISVQQCFSRYYNIDLSRKTVPT